MGEGRTQVPPSGPLSTMATLAPYRSAARRASRSQLCGRCGCDTVVRLTGRCLPCTQIEYYFSEANYAKDKFLQAEVAKEVAKGVRASIRRSRRGRYSRCRQRAKPGSRA